MQPVKEDPVCDGGKTWAPAFIANLTRENNESAPLR
jgi:hypothetical protein